MVVVSKVGPAFTMRNCNRQFRTGHVLEEYRRASNLSVYDLYHRYVRLKSFTPIRLEFWPILCTRYDSSQLTDELTTIADGKGKRIGSFEKLDEFSPSSLV
jgi:hypothetical protein